MKALFFKQHGDIENLEFGERPDPELSPGQVVVQVKACALNHLDLWVLKGWPGLDIELPHIGGSDISGVVHSVGEDITDWNAGDKVVVNPGISTVEDEWTKRGEESVSPGYKIIGEHIPGGFAEYISVPAGNLYPLGKKLSFESGAAQLLVGLTCWRMLFVQGKLTRDQTVLIVGSGGGVNSFAALLAKAAGAKVIVLGSTKKLERAEQLGADHLIDYEKTENWSKEVYKLTNKRGVDLVVDNVGEKTMPQSIKAVTRGGTIVTVGNTSGYELKIDNRMIFTKQITIVGSTMGSKGDFESMLSFVSTHNIEPIIDCTMPLAEGKKAYQKLEKGEQFGKIVLNP